MPLPGAGVVLREKKESSGGTFAKYKKIKKRLSQSFGKLSELIFKRDSLEYTRQSCEYDYILIK